jgi:hypothetical protein
MTSVFFDILSRARFLPLLRAEFVGKDLKQLLISRPYSLIGPPPEIRCVYPLGT